MHCDKFSWNWPSGSEEYVQMSSMWWCCGRKFSSHAGDRGWHVKEPSLLNGHECRAYVKMCCPSSVMVTSPNEWKNLEWGQKKNTKQTNKQMASMTLSLYYLPLRKKLSRHITNLNPIYPMMPFFKFGWNWSCGSEEDY